MSEIKRLTDAEILAQHDRSVRPRVRMELAIVNELIRQATARGYTLKIAEYEQDGEHEYDFKVAVFGLDDASVIVYDKPGPECAGRIGWIRLVFGNDGYDLVSDYTTRLEEFLRPVNDLADRLAEGLE